MPPRIHVRFGAGYDGGLANDGPYTGVVVDLLITGDGFISPVSFHPGDLLFINFFVFLRKKKMMCSK